MSLWLKTHVFGGKSDFFSKLHIFMHFFGELCIFVDGLFNGFFNVFF